MNKFLSLAKPGGGIYTTTLHQFRFNSYMKKSFWYEQMGCWCETNDKEKDHIFLHDTLTLFKALGRSLPPRDHGLLSGEAEKVIHVHT